MYRKLTVLLIHWKLQSYSKPFYNRTKGKPLVQFLRNLQRCHTDYHTSWEVGKKRHSSIVIPHHLNCLLCAPKIFSKSLTCKLGDLQQEPNAYVIFDWQMTIFDGKTTSKLKHTIEELNRETLYVGLKIEKKKKTYSTIMKKLHVIYGEAKKRFTDDIYLHATTDTNQSFTRARGKYYV